MLAPHQARRAAEGGESHQLDQRPVLDHRRRLTPATAGPLSAGLDMDPDRIINWVVDAEDGDVTESNKQLAHGGRVGFHRGSPF